MTKATSFEVKWIYTNTWHEEFNLDFLKKWPHEEISSNDSGMCHLTHLLLRVPAKAIQYIIISAVQQPLFLCIQIPSAFSSRILKELFSNVKIMVHYWMSEVPFLLSEMWSTGSKNSNLLSLLMKCSHLRTWGMQNLLSPCSCQTQNILWAPPGAESPPRGERGVFSEPFILSI